MGYSCNVSHRGHSGVCVLPAFFRPLLACHQVVPQFTECVSSLFTWVTECVSSCSHGLLNVSVQNAYGVFCTFKEQSTQPSTHLSFYVDNDPRLWGSFTRMRPRANHEENSPLTLVEAACNTGYLASVTRAVDRRKA
jgi:hypothetical protein